MAAYAHTVSSVATLRTIKLYVTPRQWLSLYDDGLIPAVTTKAQDLTTLGLIQKILPDEMLVEVFLRAGPADVARAALVCRQFAPITTGVRFGLSLPIQLLWILKYGKTATRQVCQEQYDNCWYDMWMYRPRVRFDGIYCSRNTYVKPGMADWNNSKPVHLIVYYRYLLFYPEGGMVYKTTPTPLREVAKHLMRTKKTRNNEGTYWGQWELDGDQLTTKIVYPGTRPCEVVTEAQLRGNCIGANNRIMVKSLNSVVEVMDPNNGDPNAFMSVRRNHLDRIKVTPYVYVAFHELDTHPLNNPVEVMDYFMID